MPPMAKKRKPPKSDGPGIKLDLDGRSYIVRHSDLSPHDVRALRAETGLSWIGLQKALATDPDVDLIAALVWLARRLEGDEITYDAALGLVSYDSDLDIDVVDNAPEDPSPEA